MKFFSTFRLFSIFQNLFFFIFIFFIVSFLNSCGLLSSSSDESTVYTKSNLVNSSYKLKNWKTLKNKGTADVVLEQSKSGSLIIINSNCRKSSSSNLAALKDSILSGIDNIEIHSEANNQLYGRDSVQMEFTGSLDGVKRSMALTMFQRDFCIYDAILISKKEELLKKDSKDFEKVLQEIFLFGKKS